MLETVERDGKRRNLNRVRRLRVTFALARRGLSQKRQRQVEVVGRRRPCRNRVETRLHLGYALAHGVAGIHRKEQAHPRRTGRVPYGDSCHVISPVSVASASEKAATPRPRCIIPPAVARTAAFLHGTVASVGERRVRIAKVGSSSLLRSTKR